MDGNLAATLARRAQTYGWRDRPLFRTGDHTGDRTYTHGAVHDAAVRAAGVLHAAGVRPGHRVLLVLPDSIEQVAALLGAFRLGAVAILAEPGQTEAEHAHILADAGPVVAVCPVELAGRFPRVHVLDPGDLADEPRRIPEPVEPGPAAPAYVQYTAGTTGPPRGAVHRQCDIEAHFTAVGLGALGLTPDDVLFSVTKGPGTTALFPMFCGAAAVLWPGGPGVHGLVDQVRRHRPTVMFAAPSLYARLVAAGDRGAFAGLRAAVSSGEPLLPALADRIEAFLGCPLLDGLGGAEVGHIFVSNTVTRRRRGSLGVPLAAYEIEVRAEELYVRGPSVMPEYLGRPEQTREVLGRDGWLRTGDLVQVDADGFVHHQGRIHDLEAVGGVRISPLEVERVLGGHPAVAEVAVVRGAGGSLRAFVVTAEGFPPSIELERALLELARARLTPHKVPGSVTFMTELPRTSAGKVRRVVLRQGA